MTTDEARAKERLDRLAEELSDMGLAEQTDFYITGRFPMDVPSSEHLGMSYRDGLYRVWYKDMGSKRALTETADFAAARDVFVREALHLAGGRGRGPEAGGGRP